ncbi:hypothetical protein RD792_016938 [Penstemon davidsonii]|uniref:Serine aminopeptidase S33 domain-containing protein n=1 Tax=Penstemon davidsonii TaxID=160366 RepID=A0ABR0CKN9_9LAMI|nr:hypothetical protein RD792_016938 [Penstemon davidsonii]
MAKLLPKRKLVPQTDLAELAFRDLKKREQAAYNVICYKDNPRLGTALELLKTTQEIEQNLEKVSLPLLILHGKDDKVTDPSVSKALYEKASSTDKKLNLYDGAYHSLLEGEPDETILQEMKRSISTGGVFFEDQEPSTSQIPVEISNAGNPPRLGFIPFFSSPAGLPCSQIASSAFTLGTVAVLPFYTLMIVAPKAEFTKKILKSSIPYIVLGSLYAYLLYLSWTPDTIRIIFASKYLLPELPGMAKMFSSEMTLASAWIHLLVVDLFAARQVYYDGLQENIETRHSVCLCLLSCPVGILAHFITKAAITRSREKTENGIH